MRNDRLTPRDRWLRSYLSRTVSYSEDHYRSDDGWAHEQWPYARPLQISISGGERYSAPGQLWTCSVSNEIQGDENE